jgi:hypothetical protein
MPIDLVCAHLNKEQLVRTEHYNVRYVQQAPRVLLTDLTDGRALGSTRAHMMLAEDMIIVP